MLVSKKYEKDQIVSFKLVNGDEVVAKIIEENDRGFLVNKPCTVMPTQQGIALMQSLFTSKIDETVTLDRAHVMMHSSTVKEIENHYIETTTGIKPASQGSIIT